MKNNKTKKARNEKNIRRIYRRHGFFYGGLYVLLIASVFSVMIWFMISSPSFMLFGKIIPRVETNQKVVALTFDDGPLPRTTEEILKILNDVDVRATFFTIGVESERHPKQLKKIIEAGHEVGNHGYSHIPMVFGTYGAIANEVERNDELIRRAGYTGFIPFRAPYNHKFITLPYYLMKHERVNISRDVITNEGWELSPETITKDIVSKVRPGSVVLLHAMYDHTISSRRAVPLIVQALRDEGYDFVTVSQLLEYER